MMTMQNAHLPLWKKIRTSVAIGAVIALGACTQADMSFENFGTSNPELDEVNAFFQGLFDFLVVGTSDPDRVPVAAKSPQDNYPILVEARRSSVNLPGRNGTDRLTASEIRRVDEIVTAYIANARGQLVISVPGAAATEPLVLGRAKQIADHAKRRGLPPSRILLRVETEDQNADSPLSVGFETLVVVVSECGDWSKEVSHDFRNVDYSNQGCAVQHNIGVMIADPADLLSMRSISYQDTIRSDGIIQAYRAGQATGAVRAAEETASAIATE